MKEYRSEKPDIILDQFVPGYHEYILSDPVRLSRVSKNFCDMIQLPEEELTGGAADLYMPLVHPEDIGAFRRFLAAMKEEEKTDTLEYRLIKGSGGVMHVKDTMTSRRLPDGQMAGYSTLSDITELKEEAESAMMIGGAVPCGLVRYTCEKTPRVTYINDQMLKIMRISRQTEKGHDPVEVYHSNIFLMIAAESRHTFSQVLRSVFINGIPSTGEVSVVKGDGTKGRLFGWTTKQKNSRGEDEFQSICIDVTERHERKKTEQEEQYLKALTGIYDLVFEIDRENSTARHMHGSLPGLGDYLKGIPMQLNATTEKWLLDRIAKEDASKLRNFLFRNIYRPENKEEGVSRIWFRYRKENGEEGRYQAVLLKASSSIVFFCCRDVPLGAASDVLRQENDTLTNQNKEMRELVRRFTDGVVGFEITRDMVRPLYVSDNAYAFFGFSEEEWAGMAQEGITIKEFVAGTGVGYEKFEELFRTGEAEFTYTDVSIGKKQTIRAVCSALETDPDEKKYVMLYSSAGADRQEESASHARVRIRTFGYFDVFVNGRPIMFKTEKAKELLAILVDRRGGYVTPEEAISLLWEDEPASPVVLARYRKVALRLKNQLEEYGAAEIIESVNGKRRLSTEQVDCDLYRYLSDPGKNAGAFHGSYLSNYSWAETTLGELTGDQA